MTVRDGRITWVGRRSEIAAAPTVDLGPGVLLPGLVNAHCHLELSHLRGLHKGVKGFVPWIGDVVAARAVAKPEAARLALREAVAWIERETGTVAIGDVSNTLDSVAPLAASALRAVVFHELIGWDPAEAEVVLKAAEDRLAKVAGEARTGEVIVRLAAHAPHSVSAALLTLLRRRGGPAAVHVAESPAEDRFLRSGDGPWSEFLSARGLRRVRFEAPGKSAVQYLDRLGILHGGLLAAHAVQVDDADVATMAARGISVVVCPSSNRNLDVGQTPLPRLLGAGIRVCLGTDSLASGDSLDVADEMALACRAFPDVPPRQLIRMATAAGASALGFVNLGTLARGKRAVFAFAPATEIPADPEAYVVSGAAKLRRVAG